MKWMLKDSRVVGGMRALHLRAPFSRAQIVLASDSHPDALLIVHRCLPSGEVMGDCISQEEWDELIAAEESLMLRHDRVEAKPHAALWVLRSSFPEREAAMKKLRGRNGAIVHEEQHDTAMVLIVDESYGDAILDEWARDAFDRAWRMAEAGNWQEAAVLAHLSWLVDIGSGLDRAALYALTLEKTSGPSDAEDIIAMEANSRGKEDMAIVRDLVDRYRKQLCLAPSIRTGSDSVIQLDIAELYPKLILLRPSLDQWKQKANEKNRMFHMGATRNATNTAREVRV